MVANKLGRLFTCSDFWYYDVPPLVTVVNAIMLAIILVYTTMVLHTPTKLEVFDVASLPIILNTKPVQINYVRLTSDDYHSMTIGVRSIMQFNQSYVEITTEDDIIFHVCQEGGGCDHPGIFVSVDDDDDDMKQTLVAFGDVTVQRRQLLRIYIGRRGSNKRFYICIFCKMGGCKRDWGKNRCTKIIALGYDANKK